VSDPAGGAPSSRIVSAIDERASGATSVLAVRARSAFGRRRPIIQIVFGHPFLWVVVRVIRFVDWALPKNLKFRIAVGVVAFWGWWFLASYFVTPMRGALTSRMGYHDVWSSVVWASLLSIMALVIGLFTFSKWR
jgi:hypothetical protein